VKIFIHFGFFGLALFLYFAKEQSQNKYRNCTLAKYGTILLGLI
jgi:hypothetical protein